MIRSPTADADIQSEISEIMLRGITGKTVPFAPKTPRMRGKLFLHDAPSERIVGGIPSCRIMGTHLAPSFVWAEIADRVRETGDCGCGGYKFVFCGFEMLYLASRRRMGRERRT